jgi:hypothetical protein
MLVVVGLLGRKSKVRMSQEMNEERTRDLGPIIEVYFRYVCYDSVDVPSHTL